MAREGVGQHTRCSLHYFDVSSCRAQTQMSLQWGFSRASLPMTSSARLPLAANRARNRSLLAMLQTAAVP